MNRGVKVVLAANLIVMAVLTFVYPHLMVAPGKLIPGHKELETDCFACHSPWRGSTSDRCISCHVPEKIGVVSTKGEPIVRARLPVAFHQKLSERSCVTCHGDHSGTRRFSRPGRFDHALLEAATRDQCHACHRSPTDDLHRQITGSCGSCHEQTRWTPATFDHDKYFALDRDHNDRCVNCHVRNDYKRYTCYGCHEHSPAGIRREHMEEGIDRFDDCVECHRSANEHDIRGRGREGGEGRGRGRDDDD